MLTVELPLIHVHECIAEMSTAHRAQHLFSTHERMFLENFEVFETENVLSLMGLEPPTFDCMTDALSFGLAMFWNAGFDGIDTFVCKLNTKYV